MFNEQSHIKAVFLIFMVLVLFPMDSLFAQELSRENQNVETEISGQPDEKSALLPIELYQKHLSPVIGGKCPMYPSCSQYCKNAIKKHGAVMGWIMACDRLIRCGRDEVNRSGRIHVNEHNLCYDPVSNNDFWLK